MLYQLNYGRRLVGPTGFEPATLCSQSRCATKLRYGPTQASPARPSGGVTSDQQCNEASRWGQRREPLAYGCPWTLQLTVSVLGSNE
jgi:hypothetical protein